MRRQVGDRIGAFFGTNEKTKTTKFLGYGTYGGDHIPPEEVMGFNFGVPNPRLDMDDGTTCWGCEVWWGGEEAIKARVEELVAMKYTIIETSMDVERARILAERKAKSG